MSKVSVVIPYYQRSAGVLRRAVNSVMQQNVEAGTELDLIIVDDESPIPGQGEIEGVQVPEKFNIILVSQKNGGVSAARNHGLDVVDARSDFIAFLDSDDIWHEDHLRTGLGILNQGHDFYFCDHGRRGMYNSHISKYCPEILKHLKGNAVGEIPVHVLARHILQSFPTNASTTIFRKEIGQDLRFESSIKSAGEDILYFSELVSKARSAAFSSRLLVECADGINMFFSQYNDWDSPLRLPIAYDRVVAHLLIRKRVKMSRENQIWIDYLIKNYRRDLVFFSLRFFIKTRKWPVQLGQLRERIPHFFLWFSSDALLVLSKKALGLYKPV